MNRVDGYGRKRYCGVGGAGIDRLNWHSDYRNGLVYRCTCMRSFRLPDGKTGPNASILRHVGALDRNRGNKQLNMWKRMP